MAGWWDENAPGEGPQRQSIDPSAPGYDPGAAGPHKGPLIDTTTGQPVGGQMTADQLKALIGSDYSPEHLKQLLPQLQAAGVEVQNQQRGDLRPRFRLPSGEVWDFGAGGWQSRGQMSPGFGDPSQAPTGGAYGGGSALGTLMPGSSGSTMGDFLRSTPGYQFQLGEGLNALQRSAAAKGTLLTGGTLKGLQQYGQGLADQTFGNWWDRYLNLAKLGQGAINQGTSST